MKVLFLSIAEAPDFQTDMIFHGGRTLFGDDFVDVRKLWHQYKEDKEKYWNNNIPYWNYPISGGSRRNMTLYGLFNSDTVDRTDIENKIKNRYFDLIIYTVRCIWTTAGYMFLDKVFEYYPPNKIIFIDGDDETLVKENPLKRQVLGKAIYFKRELTQDIDGVYPISFAVPEEKITTVLPDKTRTYAYLMPGDMSTYIYDKEEDYYNGYKESYFAMTTKKAGWDCLRHYEILANRCVPFFPNLENCPRQTMHMFPKKLILKSNEIVRSGSFKKDWYLEFENELYEYTKQHLTTTSLMKYILDVAKNIS